MNHPMSIEPRAPLYAWGQYMVALCDLINDGSHPDQPPMAVLVKAGDVGEIVNVGHHTQENEPVYLVEFGRCVVGCLEEELAPVPKGWLPDSDVAPDGRDMA